MAKFCANLSFMFTELPFLARYRAAKEAGFECVESGFPFGFTQDQVVKAKNEAGVQQILVNSYTGDVTKGELGFAAIPGMESEFKTSIETTVQYAKALGAKKVHVMAGKLSTAPTAANDLAYENNLRLATKIFEAENLICLIEPINSYSIPNYYLNSYEKAVEVIKKVNSQNLRLMLDVFHMQHIRGNIYHGINDLIGYIGHVQVAQVPHRNEPDTPGEINYKYVIDALNAAGYTDWIGLEYKPKDDAVHGLKWIHQFGYSL